MGSRRAEGRGVRPYVRYRPRYWGHHGVREGGVVENSRSRPEPSGGPRTGVGRPCARGEGRGALPRVVVAVQGRAPWPCGRGGVADPKVVNCLCGVEARREMLGAGHRCRHVGIQMGCGGYPVDRGIQGPTRPLGGGGGADRGGAGGSGAFRPREWGPAGGVALLPLCLTTTRPPDWGCDVRRVASYLGGTVFGVEILPAASVRCGLREEGLPLHGQ